MDTEERLRKQEDLEKLRLRKRELEKKLDLEIKKARRLEAEIEQLEALKKAFKDDVIEGEEQNKKETNVKENIKKEKH